jgi:hypothetical protein
MSASATATAGPAGQVRRRPRDWVVDTLAFLAAVVFGLLVIGGRLEASAPTLPGWLLTADVVAGAVGCAGLAERVALAGGRLEHGPTPSGGWRLAAWLPWPA